MRSLVALAKPQPDLTSLIDPDHSSFLHPEDMLSAIAQYCGSTDQPAPSDQAGYVQTIFESLALKYRYVLECLGQLTGQTIPDHSCGWRAALAIPFSTNISLTRPAAVLWLDRLRRRRWGMS